MLSNKNMKRILFSLLPVNAHGEIHSPIQSIQLFNREQVNQSFVRLYHEIYLLEGTSRAQQRLIYYLRLACKKTLNHSAMMELPHAFWEIVIKGLSHMHEKSDDPWLHLFMQWANFQSLRDHLPLAKQKSQLVLMIALLKHLPIPLCDSEFFHSFSDILFQMESDFELQERGVENIDIAPITLAWQKNYHLLFSSNVSNIALRLWEFFSHIEAVKYGFHYTQYRII